MPLGSYMCWAGMLYVRFPNKPTRIYFLLPHLVPSLVKIVRFFPFSTLSSWLNLFLYCIGGLGDRFRGAISHVVVHSYDGFVGLALVGKDSVFRFIIEYSS